MLRMREVTTATLLRFLPANALMVLGVVFVFPGGPHTPPPGYITFLAQLVAAGTVGFGATLLAYRTRLGPDAAVTGRRSVLAGVFGTMLMGAAGLAMAKFALGGPVVANAIWVATGAVAGGVLYWPWLSRKAAHSPTLPWEGANTGALNAAESVFSSGRTRNRDSM